MNTSPTLGLHTRLFRSIVTASFGLSLMTAGGLARAPKPESPRAPTAESISARIIRLKEVRVHDTAKKGEDGFSMFDKPGLTLTLKFDVPAGMKVLNVEEPASIKALDSGGTDLTKVEPGFNGKAQFMGMAFDDDKQKGEVPIVLLPAARTATTFDLSMVSEVTLYREVSKVTVAGLTATGSEWIDLPADTFGTGAKARVKMSRGSVQIETKPESLHDAIAEVAFVSSGETMESQGSMWGMGTCTFMFPGKPKDNAKVVFDVRTGFEKRAITVEAKDVALP